MSRLGLATKRLCELRQVAVFLSLCSKCTIFTRKGCGTFVVFRLCLERGLCLGPYSDL